jgi:hypothetical protein
LTEVSKNFEERFEELCRNIGKPSKEYWKKVRRTSKEPSNFLDIIIKLRTKFKRTYEGSFKELGKSFEGIFEVLGQVFQSSWKKISKYIRKNFEFLFERFEQTIFFQRCEISRIPPNSIIRVIRRKPKKTEENQRKPNLAIIAQNRGALPKSGISFEGITIFLEKILAKTPNPKLLRSIPGSSRKRRMSGGKK